MKESVEDAACQRRVEVAEIYLSTDITLAEIGALIGVSRQRVHQLVTQGIEDRYMAMLRTRISGAEGGARCRECDWVWHPRVEELRAHLAYMAGRNHCARTGHDVELTRVITARKSEDEGPEHPLADAGID